MTPSEHWAESARLVNDWQQAVDELDDSDLFELARQVAAGHDLAVQTLAAAQVHATLAAAGATFLAATNGYETARDQLGDAINGGAR